MLDFRTAFISILVSTTAFAAITINEFHYDNVGTDVGEFVEVVADTADRSDILAGRAILYLYNGANGATYGTHNLTGFVYHGTLADGKDYYSKLIPDIQNGAPDGLALVFRGVVVEFLSYEGTFVATSGPANGITSIDIGVFETPTTPVGSSLQRIAFSGYWVLTPGSNTRGAINIPAPGPLTLVLFGLPGAVGILRRRR